MADLTWYSKAKSDEVFATKAELAAAQLAGPGAAPDLSAYATKADMASADAALSSRIDGVKATADAALPAATASSTYATKAEVEEVRKAVPQPTPAPDLTPYAKKADTDAADGALGKRIDSVSAVASAAAPMSALAPYATTAAVAGTYATKEALSGYLKATDASDTYATKSDLAQAQLGGGAQAPDLSGLATKAEVRQADTALGARIDGVKATAEAALPATTAATTYATKADVSSADAALGQRIDTVSAKADAALPAATASTTYATKAEVSAARAAAEGALTDTAASAKYAAKADLSQYATTSSVSSTYATKEALTAATAPVAGLTSKVTAMETAVGKKADTTALVGFLPKAEATATYATKTDLEGVRAAIPQTPQEPDLSAYLRSSDAASTYATKASLADYVTRSDAGQQYATNENLQRELALKAGLTDLNDVTRRVDSLGAVLSPFKPGERYYSPVTYFWPDYYQKAPNVSKWGQILKFAGSLGIVILNRNSGNWDEFNVDFKKQAELALAAGAKRAVFYVKTQYLSAALPAGDPGRANVPDVDKYTEDYILGQIDKAKTQYGDVCQGVFLDETINGWGAQAGRVPAYKALIDRIRAKYGKDFLIVVNSGSNISEDMCKLDFDVCMMFEKDATAFLNEDPSTPILPDHMKAYPSTRWWAVVHGVTSENYRKVFDKADSLDIAHLYITDGQLREDPQRGGQWEPVGNPYANPPSDHIHELVVPWLKGYLPLKLEVDDLRSRPRILSLGKHEAVPTGTPAGTIIVRKEA